MPKKNSEVEKNEGCKGRPNGAENIDRPTVKVVSARCPTCGASKYTAMPGSRPVVRQIDGVTSDGWIYHYVVWRKVICKCGQHFQTREETTHDPQEEASERK